MPEKVERHIQAFNQYVDAELVITNGTIVDKLGNPLDNAFCPNVKAVTSANVKKKVDHPGCRSPGDMVSGLAPLYKDLSGLLPNILFGPFIRFRLFA